MEGHRLRVGRLIWGQRARERSLSRWGSCCGELVRCEWGRERWLGGVVGCDEGHMVGELKALPSHPVGLAAVWH